MVEYYHHMNRSKYVHKHIKTEQLYANNSTIRSESGNK